MDKGKIDVYRNEELYIENENPVNRRPIDLIEYKIILNPKKAALRASSSLAKTMKKAVSGNVDFAVKAQMSASFDMLTAVNSCVIYLEPKIKSELEVAPHYEFLAEDIKEFNGWRDNLKQVQE